ncbi:MAG: hypothetical protein ABI380_01265 [Edaphobacter sp.]
MIIPPGAWHDFWTGQAIAGWSTLHLHDTERNIPVFVKAGSVMPIAQITSSTADDLSRHLLVQVYGDGNLAWQDGSGSDQGTELRWNKESQGGEVISNEGYIVKGWKHMS